MRYYALLLVVSFLTRLPSLFIRVIDADEAVYANTSRGILKGLVLYRDLIDQKPPLIYYVYALFMGIVNDLRFVHAISVIVVWITAIAMYHLVARCFDRHSGVVAGILYAAFVSTVGYASNTEIFMNLPLVLGVWFFFRNYSGEEACISPGVGRQAIPWGDTRSRSVYHPGGCTSKSDVQSPGRYTLHACFMLVAGIFIGIASLIKQQAIVAMLPLCLMIIVTRFREKIGRGLCELLVLFIGAVFPFVLVLLYFWKLNVMHDFIHWAFLYNMHYIVPESSLLPILIKAALVAVLPTIILWWYSLKRIGELRSSDGDHRSVIVFGLLWLAASIYAVALGQRLYTHYFVQLIPPLVFVAAQPIAGRLSNLRRLHPINRIVFLSFLIIPAVAVTMTVGIKGLRGGFDCQKPSVVWASEFIDSQTKPGDRIFVWGDAVIQYLADRQSSSRFMNAAFIFENRDPCYLAPGVDVSKYAGTKEFGMLMSDLQSKSPMFIVDTSSSDIHCWQNYPLDKFVPLADLINKKYRNVGEYDGVRIWSRK